MPEQTQSGGEIAVEQTVTIAKEPREVYQFWRDFENLPRFMKHLRRVVNTGERRSHWIAEAPLGQKVEWDAEITNEEEDRLIAWSSTGPTPVPNSGRVRFEETPRGGETVVRVYLSYHPPAGAAGATAARLLGEEPSRQIDEDLRRFKSVLEAGEIPTIEGQPSGRSK